MKIAICLIIKDENEYLEEWMNYHRKVGVSHFYIYDNNSKVPISEFLKNETDVTVRRWPYTQNGSQWLAYQDCCRTYQNEADKIAFIDTDEFISFDPKFNTIQEVWESLESQYGKIDSLGLYWRMYGKSKPYFETRQPVQNYTEYFENFHIKSVLDPKTVKYFSDPHHAYTNGKYINEKNEDIVGPFGSKGQPHNDSHSSNIIWIKHTWTRSRIEFETKLKRGTGDHFQRTRTMQEFYDHNDKCKKMTNQTFIFVHDQDIILDFERVGKFKDVDNLNYVFVSNNPSDKIKDMKNVIIAKDYDDNIEKYNRTLIAYTGWYLIWKNKLATADYINLFEYDIILSPNFQEELNQTIAKVPDVVGYLPLPSNHVMFLKVENNAGPLVRSIIKNYNINPIEIIDSLPERTISVTFNHTLKRETFENFMKWMEPIVEDIKEEKMAGHFPERALPFYYTLNNLNMHLLEGRVKHFQMDTHDTQGKTKIFFESNYNNLLNGK